MKKYYRQDCWVDPSYPTDKDGYVFLWDGQQSVRAHLKAYQVLVGIPPVGLIADHICRNRACFNPAHIEFVTPQENVRRGLAYRNGICSVHRWELNEITAFKHKNRKSAVEGFVWVCRKCNNDYQRKRYWQRKNSTRV